MEKLLKRIVKPVMDAQPDAPAAIIADIVLIEHRGLLHGWLIGQIDVERKRQNSPAPSGSRRGRRVPDPRQDWFDLPEFKDIRSQVQGDTLEEFQQRIAELEQRIKSYNYARLSAEKEKSDRRELKAMLRLKKVLTPFFAGDPTMTIGKALKLYQKQRETARSQRQRKAATGRWGSHGKPTA